MDSSNIKDEIIEQIYIANHECPVATVEEPLFSDEGVSKDKAIKISFSVPVDPNTFEENYTIKDSNGNDLSNYYLTPQWSSGYKFVMIPVDKTNLINLGSNKTLDITLSISTNCKTSDNLPLKQAINHKFRIKDDISSDEYPVATVDKPVFNYDGVAKDTDIVISFTVPVDRRSFYNSYVIKDSNGNDLKENYMEPEWSEDSRVVTISADKKNLIDLGGNKTQDVIISLSKDCKTDDGLPIKKAIDHKFRINEEIESDECPVAKVESPTFNEDGVTKDKDIVISFTVPVNPNTFKDSYSIVDNYGNDLKTYYLEPQWSEENKKVTIPVDKTNLINLGSNKTLDINVSINKNCKTEKNFPIKSSINYRFRIKDEIGSDEYPVASVESPEFSGSGVAKDKDIVIKFTVPVDPNSFKKYYSIKDNFNTDLSKYYKDPVWSNDNKTVTIPVDKTNLIDLGSNKTLDIILTVSDKCTTVSKLSLKSELQYNFRIKDEIESSEFPEANVDSPRYSDEGVPKDRTIKISFTQPVNPVTFTNNFSITDTDGNDLKPYYKQAQWANNNKLVTIQADYTNLIDLGSNKNLDVIVSVSKNCKTAELLPLKSDLSYKFRIKDEIESDEFPVVRVEEPIFTNEGVSKDKAIKISFSVPVDKNTFAENLTITDSSGTNLKNHYKEAEWSNNDKLVTLYADKNNLINLAGNNTLDVIVSLSKKCKTTSNIPINKAISNYKFRINDEIESSDFPLATVEEPRFADDGVAKDKDIKISFTVPVNPDSFNENYTLTDVYGNDLKRYYKDPQWSDGNKTVTISPDKTNLIEIGANKTLDVIFALSSACKSEENLFLKRPVNHKFRLKEDVAGDEYPEANVIQPTFSEDGVKKNRAIIITFTKPVDTETFAENFEIKDSAGYDLKQYFMEPKWSINADGTTQVTIAANELNLIDLRGNRTQDIFVSLSKNCKTEDAIPLKANLNYRYRINDGIDNEAPEIKATRATLPDSFIPNKSGNGVVELIEGDITEESEEDICQTNHINSKFNMYVEGTDYGGGKVSAIISYRQVYEVTGNRVTEDAKTVKLNLENRTQAGFLCGEYTIDLSDEKYNDGMYEVKVYVQDAYALNSEECKVYYVIRDTSLPYCVTSRFVNDIPTFRNDNINEYINDFNKQTPTYKKIEDYKTRIFFDKISDDIYYTSNLTEKSYGDKMEDLSYYLSWGLSLDELTVPVKIDGYITDDPTITQAAGYMLIYDVPENFLTFIKQNESEDIIVSATVLDCVGNQNKIDTLYPRKMEFNNYVVSNDEENSGKKKVKLNFMNAMNNKIIPNYKIYPKCRIFYGPLGEYTENDDLSDLPLQRNPALPFDDDIYDKLSDSDVIKNLEINSQYVVYIQALYEFESLLNGQWNATTHGPLCKVIIDTTDTPLVNVETPTFEVKEKKSAGINTGLINITVKIDNEVYNNNKTLGVKYIPYFKPENYFDGSYNVIPGTWTNYESHEEQTFTFTVKNPLRAPLGYGESWDSVYWDGPVRNGRVDGDYNYIKAVRSCKEHGLDYTSIRGFIKIVAATDNNTIESLEETISFDEDDDNIPPRQLSDITFHDSHLSFDGHAFEFDDVIREDEGHASEYFNWYYTPYNSAWGDNLSVKTPEQIEMLPGGVTTYTGTTYLGHDDDWDIGPDGQPRRHGAQYRMSASIPVFGLPDGEYMYFAKTTDTYGNYTYVTLGKGHIGTFKNKLSVELPDSKDHFICNLELAPDEQNFDRNMISIQSLAVSWDNPDDNNWGSHYNYLNELQDCSKKIEGGKTYLYSYVGSEDDSNKFFRGESGGIIPVEPNNLNGWNYYRISMQSFNENSLEGHWGENGAIIEKDGVDRKYGRPYHYSVGENNVINDIYTHDVLGWIDGETQYDVCTEETVSNTVYYYVPGDEENFSDFYASFFASTAIARSNHHFIVNVYASGRDLGNDVDEWERRGQLIKTHFYSPNRPGDHYVDENGHEVSLYNQEFDMNVNPFDYNKASNDVADSHLKGLIYYVAVAHFADNSTAISDVYTMYGF